MPKIRHMFSDQTTKFDGILSLVLVALQEWYYPNSSA